MHQIVRVLTVVVVAVPLVALGASRASVVEAGAGSAVGSGTAVSYVTLEGPVTCRGHQIRVNLRPKRVTGGNIYQRVRFVNTSSSICSLRGAPRITFHNRFGTKVGYSAHPPRGRSKTVLLRPGDRAGAQLVVPVSDNFRPADCLAYKAPAIRIKPPHISRQTGFQRASRICTTQYGRADVTNVVALPG